MFKYFLIFLLVTLLNTKPLFSQDNFNITLSSAINSKKTLGFYNNIRTQNRSNIKLDLRYSKEDLSSQLSLNYGDSDKLSFDDSFANYQIGITDINIGKINRIWSFSNQSSLILSSNARPLEAVSIKIKNQFDTQWLPKNAKWSIEAITASNKKSYKDKNSILSGARIVLSPSERLDLEIFQTSQWGGNNKKITSSTIGTILLGNSNEGHNSSINKMAGFGISYKMPSNKKNYYRIYGQIVGEDEAGSLPSCYASLSGIELSMPKIKFPTIATIEFIDTRVAYTTHGYCGPNTMYNNGIYDYTNYATTMGVPIDSEGKSLEFFGKTQLYENFNINYSIKLLTINDDNYSLNRLSSKRSSGSIKSLGFSWRKNNMSFNGNIGYQDLALDKVNITKSAIFSLGSSISF